MREAPIPNILSTRIKEMEHSVEKKRSVDAKCGYCADMPYAHARACGAYAGSLEASVLFLKSHPHICRRLRRYLARVVSENGELLASDLVAPVPLHRLRLKERGFNQAAVIAKAVSEDLNIPLDKASLTRIKQTERHRAGVDRIDRERSVKGAFEVARPRLVTGKIVLLVDDIYTTGSTISASARALLEAGAERVNVLTIARAVNDSQYFL